MKKEIYKHNYSGSWAPKSKGSPMSNTFSVGIFQWLPKTSGKGLKKSAVKFRIKGNVTYPDSVYAIAEFWCNSMDNGIYPETKSMTV